MKPRTAKRSTKSVKVDQGAGHSINDLPQPLSSPNVAKSVDPLKAEVQPGHQPLVHQTAAEIADSSMGAPLPRNRSSRSRSQSKHFDPPSADCPSVGNAPQIEGIFSSKQPGNKAASRVFHSPRLR